MKASDGKFLVQFEDETKRFHDDEPVFVFRGQDKFMHAILARYWDLCEAYDCDEAHLAGIDRQMDDVMEWQSTHSELVKLPD